MSEIDLTGLFDTGPVTKIQLADGTIALVPKDASDDEIDKRVQGYQMRTERLGGPVAGALDVATLGWSDEILAGMMTPFRVAQSYIAGRQSESLPKTVANVYGREKTQTQAITDKARENYPKSSLALGLGATLATGLAGLGGKFIGAGMQSTKPLLSTMARSGAVGGAVGGVAGAGEAETMAEVPEKAMTGAGAGAAFGALAVPVVAGAQNVGRRVANRFFTNPDEVAVSKLAQALQRDKMAPQDLADEVAKAPRGATVMDIGGENTKGLANAVANRPGAGRELVRETLQGRRAEQALRTAQQLDDLSATRRAKETYDQIIAARKAAAASDYKVVDDFGKVNSKAISDLMDDDPIFGRAIAKVARVAKKSEAFDPKNLTLRQMDMVKKEIDDMIGAAKRGGKDNAARAMTETRNQWLAKLDEVEPGYKVARDAYAGRKALENAIDDGKTFLNMKRGDLQNLWGGYTESEKDMFRIGVRDAIDDMMGGARRGSDALGRFDTPNMSEKMAIIFDSPNKAQAFDDFVRWERDFVKAENRILGGSKTAGLQQDMAEMDKPVAEIASDVLDIATGSPSAIAKKVLQSLSGAKNTIAMSEDVSEALANRIFAMNPSRRAKVVREIMQQAGKPAVTLPGGKEMTKREIVDLLASIGVGGEAAIATN